MENEEEKQIDVQDQKSLEQLKHCWVCFATEEDDGTSSWVKPCKCKGSAQWVHQACLQRWIDEKQKGQTSSRVACPQCNTNYVIIYPKLATTLLLLDTIDAVTVKVSPLLCAGIVVGSVYWAAATYGALTVLQIYGYSEGIALMESMDTFPFVVGLPLIPAGLLAGKMISWEEPVLQFLRKYVPRIPIVKYLLPVFNFQPGKDQAMRDLSVNSVEPEAVTVRRFCGALFLPTYAVLCGSFFFGHIKGSLKRALVGGAFYLFAKGVIKVYHRQARYVRQYQRQIVDYDTGQSLALLTRLQRHVQNRQIIL